MITRELILKSEDLLKGKYEEIEKISLFNQEKVLNAFKKNRIALRHFNGTSGYGYDDEGRNALNLLIADIFKAERAICSPNLVSGTHALSSCLYGILRPNDLFLSITGEPYDTLEDVINGDGNGSLKDFGIKFNSISLKDGNIDKESIKKFLTTNNVKMIYMQRSRGYEWRDAFSVDKIEEAVKFIRSLNFDGCIMLDNCYGEFVEEKEPIEVGVNVIAGSMIKNLGGGIAPTGGYIAGDSKYIDLIQNRITAPSIGGEVGSYAFGYQYFYEGIFLAPHVVKETLKGSLLFRKVLQELGYEVLPSIDTKPSDIITSIKFGNEKDLISFIQAIQKNSPIDSFVDAEPWEMPGYKDKVIMAAGCFVQGASIELSADAPIRPPYIAYMQGGLTYEHLKIVLKNIDL